jgi:hypothetical protein
MANALHMTYYEGDDDGSVLDALEAEGLLPSDMKIIGRTERKTFGGKEGMIKALVPLVNPAGGAGKSAVALRDLDELSIDQIHKWFTGTMNVELPKSPQSIQVIHQAPTTTVLHFHITAADQPRVGRVVVVPVGLPNSIGFTEYGITQFAMDDFILLLVHDPNVYGAISECKDVSHELALKKLSKIVDLMKANAIPIRHTKRLMHLFRAITNFRAAPAVFADRVIHKGVEVLGKDRVKTLFDPLLTCLTEASRLLTPKEPQAELEGQT